MWFPGVEGTVAQCVRGWEARVRAETHNQPSMTQYRYAMRSTALVVWSTKQ